MKPTDFLTVIGLIALFANTALERAGRALPQGVKPEWITWVGVALLVIGIAARVPDIVKALGERRAKYGANTAVFVLVVAAILGAVNWIANRNPKRFDLSKEQRFSLSPQTKQILQGLKEDVKIAYVQRAAGSTSIAKDRLNEFTAASSRVKLEFVDPFKNPGRTRELEVTAVPTLVVTYGPRTERITSDGEADIANAIVKVTRTESKAVCFASGQGERDADDSSEQGYSGAKAALAKSQYETKKVVLLQEQGVPADCTVLVVAGVTRDLVPQVADYIRHYIRGGGKALLMNDAPTKASSPQFDGLLKDFGAEAKPNVVVDASGMGQLFGTGYFTPIVVDYPYHEINKDLKGTMSAFHTARTLQAVTPQPEGVVATEIAKTSARSWGETDLALKEPIEPGDRDDRGPLNLAIAATVKVATAPPSPSPSPAPTESPADAPATPVNEGRVVAVGDADFASNALLTFQANQDLFLNMVAWLARDSDLISIRPKDPGTHKLDLTTAQQRTFLYFSLFGLPGFFVLWGIWNWWSRRS
jgi:ABC-type uncharacterized transport system involved in gliding motility auxiliary subunit